jgi:hypothetical protein
MMAVAYLPSGILSNPNFLLAMTMNWRKSWGSYDVPHRTVAM